MLSNVPEQLIIATRNDGKTREYRELLGNEFQIGDLSGLAAAAVDECGTTFEENAILKAISASQDQPGQLVIADDSGLEVHSLGGAPGIFSARYAGTNATDQTNIEKLLRELKSARDRSARFRCLIALASDGQLVRTFEDAVEGIITNSPRGTGGFGYDPVFLPNGFDQTFAEMTAKVKNQISHRAKAAGALRDFLRENRR